MSKLFRLLVLGMSLSLLTGCISSGQKQDEPGKTDPDPSEPSDPTNPDDPGYEPPVVTTNTVSYTVADLAELYAWENDTKYQSFALDGAVTVTSSEGQYNGKYFESGGGQYRLYSADKGTITFAVSGERELNSITVTYVSHSKGELVGLASGTAKEVSGKSVTFNVGDAGQVRITAFSVTYTGTKGEDIKPYIKEGWTAAELELIEENIYGVSVPFVNFGKGTVLQQDSYSGALYIQIENATLADYSTYLNAFVEEEVFVCTDKDIPENDAIFKATVETAEGIRYVMVNIVLIDEDENLITDQDAIGTLQIVLQDPYYYAWDAELIEEIIASLKSTATLPEVDNITYFNLVAHDNEAFMFLFFNQPDTSLEAYKAKLAGWDVSETVTDVIGSTFYAIPASGDLEIELIYSPEDQVLYLTIYKHLPRYNSYPMEQIKEYLKGYEPFEVVGAEYYTVEVLDQEFDIGEDEPFVIELGIQLTAYNLSLDKYNAFFTALSTEDFTSVEKVDEEDDDGNKYSYYVVTVSRQTTDGFYYTYSFMYYEEEAALLINYNPNSGAIHFEGDVATWAELINLINTRFLTPKELSVDLIPELTAESYSYEIDLNNGYYVDCATIVAGGNLEAAWTAILNTSGYDVPTKPDSDYGYECISSDGSIEIDVLYDSENDVTTAIIYSVIDFE